MGGQILDFEAKDIRDYKSHNSRYDLVSYEQYKDCICFDLEQNHKVFRLPISA